MRRLDLKDDGLPARYSPDFLVRTNSDVYLVETKSQTGMSDENVRRKARSAVAWVDQLNQLEPGDRDEREWSYVLLAEDTARGAKSGGASVSDVLAMAKLRHLERPTQGTLL